ncbi:MAG: hypothetical protein HGA22_07095 [Clostridiales bacterium]|nr:hypothetical protein [Clostridiales bacterium]
MAAVSFPYSRIGAISFILLVLAVVSGLAIASGLASFRGIDIREIRGGRGSRKGGNKLYGRYFDAVRRSSSSFKSSKRTGDSFLGGIYSKARLKLKKSGYSGDSAVVVYLFVKYPLVAFIGALAFIVNYPGILPSIMVMVLLEVIPEMILAGGRKAINMQFQRYIYKIYKYLHNQISSGVRVTDAIKTVYEVV